MTAELRAGGICCNHKRVARLMRVHGIQAKTVKKFKKVQETFDTEPPENIMDKAVAYIKSSSDKKKAFNSIMDKYEASLTEKQVAGLKKFVR